MANENDSFREDMLAVLFHLRISQMMLNLLRENPHNREDRDREVITRKSKEIFMKLDWFCGLVDKILQDEDLRKELALRDDKLANIANISSFIATFKGDLSNEADFIVSSARRKELLNECWTTAQADQYDFEEWYKETFPNNITLLQKMNQ